MLTLVQGLLAEPDLFAVHEAQEREHTMPVIESPVERMQADGAIALLPHA